MRHDPSVRRLPTAYQTHAEAVLDAEVGLLVDQLRRFGGTLERRQLARCVDARLWREGTFDRALRAGVERGVLLVMPGDLVRLSREA